jgi:hypothetical protein
MESGARLLDEVIDQAVEGDGKIATLLRKCTLLSVDFGNGNLREWVYKELNGYDDWKNLPPYRVIRVGSKGLFLGPFGSQINDQPLASSVLKEEHRDFAEKAFFTDPASAYENLHDDGKAGYKIEWSGDLVVMYQSSFFKGHVLNRAWQDIPIYSLRSIPETVTNRILEFALSVREEFGGEIAASKSEVNEYVDSAVANILKGP